MNPQERESPERQVLESAVLARELQYHEKLYSGFAQSHFAKAGVRAFREHSVRRIVNLTGMNRTSRVLSIGCGIGDTELLLAPRVQEIVGVDLSPKAIAQANRDAARQGIGNARFVEGTIDAVAGEFDAVIAIFFLHHLSDAALEALPYELHGRLKPGGVVYTLDPNVRRLAGRVGRMLIPKLMKKYQTEDERELEPEFTEGLFRKAGFQVTGAMYDFGSTAFAGLFPGWSGGYRIARAVDDVVLRWRVAREMGASFEVVARRG